jgi:putative endonuclease
MTSDIQRRLEEHNSGKSSHTSKFMPWVVETYFCLADIEKARRFEKYLKTGSGLAFRQRHF